MFAVHLVDFLLDLFLDLLLLLVFLLEGAVQVLQVFDEALHAKFLHEGEGYLERLVEMLIIDGLLSFLLTDFIGLGGHPVDEL